MRLRPNHRQRVSAGTRNLGPHRQHLSLRTNRGQPQPGVRNNHAFLVKIQRKVANASGEAALASVNPDPFVVEPLQMEPFHPKQKVRPRHPSQDSLQPHLPNHPKIMINSPTSIDDNNSLTCIRPITKSAATSSTSTRKRRNHRRIRETCT